MAFPLGLDTHRWRLPLDLSRFPGDFPVGGRALISLTNLTSAGQFAGTNLILQGAGYIEVAMTTFVINIRYMLMSLSLGQRLEKGTGILSRMGLWLWDHRRNLCHGVPEAWDPPGALSVWTDPIPDPGLESGYDPGRKHFCSAAGSPPECHGDRFIRYVYCADRTGLPDSIHVFLIVVMAVAANCMLKYIPVFSFISPGFRIILSTVAGAGLGAALFPRDEAEYVKKEGETE